VLLFPIAIAFKMSSSDNQRPRKYTEEEIFTLLCSLNTHIDDIRKEFEADKKSGVAYASHVLSKAIGNDRTPASVRAKIDHLWREAGPSNGMDAKQHADLIYLTGAWTRTLPSLDALYPDMLERIASASKSQNK